ncbi:MAG: hypothetical protein ACPGUC_01405 [Gammaproteobacteria bacterium]
MTDQNEWAEWREVAEENPEQAEVIMEMMMAIDEDEDTQEAA